MRFTLWFLLFVSAFVFSSSAQALTLVPMTPMTNSTDCGSNDPVRYRVANFNGQCGSAYIQVKAGSLVVQTVRRAENEEIAVDPAWHTGKIVIDASCGPDRVSQYYFRDRNAPTFTALTVHGARNGWVKSPVAIGFEGVVDDGNFPIGYGLRSTVDGTFAGSVKALGVSLPLGEGEHKVLLRLVDYCNRASRSSEVTFKVDNRAPTGSFVKPDADQIVQKGNNLFINVAVGDPGSSNASGLSLAAVYLDNIPDEFHPGLPLCRFNGPWIIGMLNQNNCTVSTSSWSHGNHHLILVVTDHANNQATVQRSIRLE